MISKIKQLFLFWKWLEQEKINAQIYCNSNFK